MPLYGYTIISLSIPLLMGVWVVLYTEVYPCHPLQKKKN